MQVSSTQNQDEFMRQNCEHTSMVIMILAPMCIEIRSMCSRGRKLERCIDTNLLIKGVPRQFHCELRSLDEAILVVRS